MSNTDMEMAGERERRSRLTIRYIEMEQAEERFNCAKRAFLRQSGWEYSCMGKGNIWMWRKVIDGQTYVTTEALAIQITLSL